MASRHRDQAVAAGSMFRAGFPSQARGIVIDPPAGGENRWWTLIPSMDESNMKV